MVRRKYTFERSWGSDANCSILPNQIEHKDNIQNIPEEYECRYCDKKFSNKRHLRIHTQKHNLSFLCQICGKQFYRSWKLQDHIRTHTGERPYGCKKCDKSFASKSGLASHKHIHTGYTKFNYRKFVCDTCCQAFTSINALRNHKVYCFDLIK